MSAPYDALLLVSFGGPESPDEVMPFLETVVRGRDVPRARLLEVAENYDRVGGRSPLNDQNRALIAALEQHLTARGLSLPIYWGNRNSPPFLTDTLREVAEAGMARVLAFVTSGYGSYSSCRQYLEDIARARAAVGSSAPVVDKIRLFFNHPGFIEATAERVGAALGQIPADRRAATRILYSAHSIPLSMARTCAYEEQLRETARLVSERLEHVEWQLVFQSRSGPPNQPWLEPDVGDALRRVARERPGADVVVAPIGFLSDHIEVIFDLDVQARKIAEKAGLNMARAATVGTHPRFVAMIGELVAERIGGGHRQVAGNLAAWPDVCPADCCPKPVHGGGRA